MDSDMETDRPEAQQTDSNPLDELTRSLHPYDLPIHQEIPDAGVSRDDILAEMREIDRSEDVKWRDGYASGAVYHGDKNHIEFLSEVYRLNSQSNPLHVDVWPSVLKYESEIISMTANMLGAGLNGADDVCGTLSSGGTESIQLAMKTYRDHAEATKGITEPNMVVPSTVHAAFDKAAQYFCIEMRHVPVGDDGRADVAATADAIDDNTVVVVGSSPSFPHGLIDPIEELSELARERGIGFHTDGCLGGFILPWARELGYDVPDFDFRLPGVTSMSADTHKFGYGAKGTSVVLYRNKDLRHYQYFTLTDWPGGIYCSPTFAGSRPGALSATAWAAMVSIGREGYLANVGAILETAAKIKSAIGEIDHVEVIGDPLFVVAIRSDDLDIYEIMDFMTKRGWSLNGLHKPPAVHLCTTLRHTQPGIADRFVDNLTEAVEFVVVNPGKSGGMAPIYGMAASVLDRSVVSNFLEFFMDQWYEI